MKKQSDGRYRAKILLGRDSTGKPVYKYLSGRSKRELEEKKKEAIRYFREGDRTSDLMPFGSYAIDWYEIRKKPFLSMGTRRLYACVLNRHLIPEFGERNISAINAMQVQAYLNSLSDKYSASRINTIRNILVALFECALQDGYVTRNPARHMRIGGTPEKEQRTFTREERTRIEQTCATHEDGLLLALLYYTGMRGGEARALKWKNVDLRSRIIHIDSAIKQDNGTYIGKTKTESSVRDVPIVDPLLNLLKRGPIGMPDTFVLHNTTNDKPIKYLLFRIRYANLMHAAGLATEIPPENRTNKMLKYEPIVSPHAFRHNMATMCWESGTIDAFTAAKILGHSSIKTTMDTYTHLSEAAKQTTLGNLNSLYVANKLPETNSNT